MIHLLNKGDRVKVWPRPGLTVRKHPDVFNGSAMLPAPALSPAGEDVAWSEWYLDLAKGGALYFSDPRHEDNGGPAGSGGVRHAAHVHPQAEGQE